MVIYLIGPSGVGKSGCARHAAEVLDRAVHADIDFMCRGREFDWPTCRDAICRVENRAGHEKLNVIVDIGAGPQCSPELREYLFPKRTQVVLIFGPPEEVVKRNPLGPNRSIEEYRETEYARRIELYSVAAHSIDVGGKTQQRAQAEFVDYLLRTFPSMRLKDEK